MKMLSEKGDLEGATSKIKKKKGLQVFWDKMGKIANLKGKYKYR